MNLRENETELGIGIGKEKETGTETEKGIEIEIEKGKGTVIEKTTTGKGAAVDACLLLLEGYHKKELIEVKINIRSGEKTGIVTRIGDI